MSDATPSREAQMLARLAELDLAAAEKAHGKLMAAEEPSDIAELGRTYQRMARSLRQTLALKAKLVRDDAQAPARPPRPRNMVTKLEAERRAATLQDALTRIAWSEYEPMEMEDFDAELDDLLCDLVEDPDFLDQPLDAQVVRVCELMGVPTTNAATWRDLPVPNAEEADVPEAADTG